MKRSKSLLTLLVITIALLAIACSGSSDLDTGSKLNENTGNTQTQDTDTPEVVKPVIYSQSDIVSIDGKKIQIQETKDYVSKNDFMQPDDGNRFFAIMVLEENTSSNSVSYNSYNYALKNVDGTDYPTAFSDIEPDFGSGDLQPTMKAKGYLSFEVPNDVLPSSLNLIYSPLSFIDSKQAVWQLN
jgi:hypothetical protein